MKQLLCTIWFALVALAMQAQHEEDFASRFMALNKSQYKMECSTISPAMMQRMMDLPHLEENDRAKELFKQLKSIRMITGSDAGNGMILFEEAEKLAQRNPNRYKPHSKNDNRMIYLRRHGGSIVEIVLFMHQKSFILIDLTGNITDKFLEQVLNI